MNLFNKLLLKTFSKTLKKNRKFKDIHKGENCYIFGNGSSLKYYDLKLFNDKPSIGCGALFAHQNVKDLDLRYYYLAHPLFFYKFWKNPYSKKYEINKVGKFYREKMGALPETQYFTSLSNYFGISGDNINYVYHFGQVDELSINNRVDRIFSMMEGSLVGMIGVALYLGFTDLTLVGCDYTFSPKMHGHFYDKGPHNTSKGPAFLAETLNLIKEKVTLRTITPVERFEGEVLLSNTYKQLVGHDPNYKENYDILDDATLKEMDSMRMGYVIY